MRRSLLLASITALHLLAGPSTAAEAPAPTDASALTDLESSDPARRRQAVDALESHGRMTDAPALVRALRDADADVRARAERALWAIWSRSGDDATDALFRQGLTLLHLGRAAASIEVWTRIIETRPAFAEGWNKRATAYFMVGELERSLADCDEVLKRNPDHFGALSGIGLIHQQSGRLEPARDAFRRALLVNPNMEGVRTQLDTIERMLAERARKAI